MHRAIDVRYAKLGDSRVAYQVRGLGPPDLIQVVGGPLGVDDIAEFPACERMFDQLASFSRLITLDFRGIGLSDPPDEHGPALEGMASDVLAVLDDVGSPRAAIFAMDFAAPAAILLAAEHPERVQALILFHACARTLQAPDYPWGLDPGAWDAFGSALAEGRFSAMPQAALIAPSALGDAEFLRWADRSHRRGGAPAHVRRFLARCAELDARHLLSKVRVPTLVLHRAGNRFVSVEQGRYVADAIPGARWVELGGSDHLPFLGPDAETAVAELREFLTGTRYAADPERTLTTVLFTDIVGSTALASALGDQQWQARLGVHDAMSAAEIRRHGGRLVKRTGDGVLATFESPALAIRCARAMADAARTHGMEIRAGVHVAEVEQRGDELAGLGIHVAARIMAQAGAGEVLVSPAVPLVMAGSGLAFRDRGLHRLKGLADEWHLYAATS